MQCVQKIVVSLNNLKEVGNVMTILLINIFSAKLITIIELKRNFYKCSFFFSNKQCMERFGQ